MVVARDRLERCPGVLRPWPAEDGALARVRLVGGRLSVDQLRGLAAVAAWAGDGDLHLTSRANLQLRGLPMNPDGSLAPEVVAAVEATGLLPSRSHDLVRNVMLSPPLPGAPRADLWPAARELDRLLQADRGLAALPGKFAFLLDDGRGDLVGRSSDVAAVALDGSSAQVRVGQAWGEQVSLAATPGLMVVLARAFLAARGGDESVWHVSELPTPFTVGFEPDPRLPACADPPAYDAQHREVPGGVLTPALLSSLVDGLADDDTLVVTPWHGVVVP